MNIDNSGNTYVFDEKTTQAIEEGKNRVTLLQIEELRLNKLKSTLEAELIRMEADLAYNTDRFTVKRDELDALEVSFEETIKQVNAASELLDKTKKDIETQKADIVDREKFCKIKEKELEEREVSLAQSEVRITKAQSVTDSKEEEVTAKIKRIEDFLNSL